MISRHIFVVNYILTIVWGIVFLYSSGPDISQKTKLWNRKRFIVIVCLQWVLISSLRADIVGADTINYVKLFDKHAQWSWNSIFRSLRTNYLKSIAAGSDEYEPGYIFLEKLISTISTNHAFYKFVIAAIWMGFLGRYLYRNSEDPCVSFIIYSGLFYNLFSLTGHRQTVSAAIGVLYAFEFIKERKLVPFVVCVMISAFFHRSTLALLPFYFLARKRITISYIRFIVGIVGIMIIFRDRIFDYVKRASGYSQYSGTYGFAQRTFIFILLLLTIVLLYARNRILNCHKDSLIYFNGLIFAWAMVPFAMVSPTSMRLVYDFGLVIMLIVPAYLNSIEDHATRRIIRFVIIAVFAYFVIMRTPEYYFFWQA